MIGTGVSLVAGIATTKALDATWRTATGSKPPTKPESPEIGSREALAWAALSGMAMGVARRTPPGGRRLLGEVVRDPAPRHGQGRDQEDQEKVRPTWSLPSRAGSGGAVAADEHAVLLGGELAAVVDEEAAGAGELVFLTRQHLDRELLV